MHRSRVSHTKLRGLARTAVVEKWWSVTSYIKTLRTHGFQEKRKLLLEDLSFITMISSWWTLCIGDADDWVREGRNANWFERKKEIVYDKKQNKKNMSLISTTITKIMLFHFEIQTHFWPNIVYNFLEMKVFGYSAIRKFSDQASTCTVANHANLS